MQNIGPETRLTDSLERELMAAAIQEQMQFKPGKAIKALIAKMAAKLRNNSSQVATKPVQAAN